MSVLVRVNVNFQKNGRLHALYVLPYILMNYYFLFSEGENSCSVDDVLVFFTAADRVPPLGFGRDCSVVFLHGAKLATASTCELELRLPTGHGEDLASFREAMMLSLKGHDGFGGLALCVPYC